MADHQKTAEQEKPQAVLTITQTQAGTNIEVQFNQPYRKGSPTLSQALALGAMEYMREFLRSQFPDSTDELHVLNRAKTH